MRSGSGRQRGGILKWVLFVVAGIFALILLGLGALYGASGRILARTYDIPPAKLQAVNDSLSLARGQHLVKALTGCADCHGPDLGGKVVVDDPVFARLYAPNLTRGTGGIFADYSLADFERTLRHGVNREGKSLWVIPSYHYCYLSDHDVAAIYAYLKTIPSVDRDVPRKSLGPVGRMLLLQKKFQLVNAPLINHDAARPAIPPEGPTVEYGQYLARASCVGCHGPNLSGGTIMDAPPTWPPAANLTRGGIAATYTEEDFFTAMRHGKRPGGADLSPIMPSESFRELTDDELHALWLYLQSCPPAAYASARWPETRAP